MRWFALVFLAASAACTPPAPPETAREAREDALDLLFLGDTAFGENYHDALRDRGRPAPLYERGRAAFLAPFRALMREADGAVVNLETPLTTRRRSPFADQKSYVHYGRRRKTADALASHGVVIASLANNHSLDFGRRGLRDTQATLANAGIASCGAGEDAADAAAPIHAPSGEDLALAVFCAFERRKTYARDYRWYAEADRSGVAALDAPALAAAIIAAKAKDPDLVAVAFLHWGANYAWTRDRQRNAAQILAAAGADLIIGHGAHQLQEIERIGQTWVVYGLGNFVFGSPGRTAAKGAPPYGLIARVQASAADRDDAAAPPALRVALYPIITDNKRTNYRPRFVTGAEFGAVEALLSAHSPDAMAEARRGRDAHGWFLELPPPPAPRPS